MKYFTILELCKSSTATRLNIQNTPKSDHLRALNNLVDKVLDPAREALKMPIIVNSGYRCDYLNMVIGGAVNSQHCKGQAADITTIGGKYDKELLGILKTLDYDQLIIEDIKSDGSFGWLHISYVSPEKNRREILGMKKINGKAVYEKQN